MMRGTRDVGGAGASMKGRHVERRGPAGRPGQRLRGNHGNPCEGGDHRRRRGRLLDPVSPGEVRLEGCGAAGAQRAYGGLVVARRRADPHHQLGPQHLAAPGLHHQPLQGDRGDLGPIGRPARHRRLLSRLERGLARLPQARALEGALYGPRPGVHLGRGGGPPPSADRFQPLHRGAVGPARRRHRPVGRDPRLRPLGPALRRRVPHPDPGHRDQPAPRRHLGRGHARRHDPRRDDRQRRRPVGRARWDASPASSCQCNPWSTTT